MGAIDAAAGRIHNGADLTLRQVLGCDLVAPWNNAPGRTQEEVLAVFDKAIAETAPEPNIDFLNRASWRTPEAVS